MSRCRSCGAPVRWIRSATTGKNMPLDAEPTSDGNILIDTLGLAHVHASPTAAIERGIPDQPRYLSHFTTCPDAAAHRRRK